MALMLNGMGVSRGVSIGDVFILRRSQYEYVEQKLEKKQLTQEVKRYKTAHSNARKQLLKLRKEIPKDCLLYTSPSPRDKRQSRMPSSA